MSGTRTITRPLAAITVNAMSVEDAAAALLLHRKQGTLHPIDYQRLQIALDARRALQATLSARLDRAIAQ